MKKALTVLVIGAVLVIGYLNLGFYSIQPIGALPDGITLVVSRQGQEPFFNSPDAMCKMATGSVSLLCRGIALGNVPSKRIIFRLPYQAWAYSLSTDGEAYSR